MSDLKFPSFPGHVCQGDAVSIEHDGFTLTATLYLDDDTSPPDQRDDGFWPSNDPEAAGYVLPENYAAEMAKAAEVMRAWNNNEWQYFGVDVVVERNGVELTKRYAHAVWGIEGNYPGSDNGYLSQVASDTIGEALDDARAVLAKLCVPAAS